MGHEKISLIDLREFRIGLLLLRNEVALSVLGQAGFDACQDFLEIGGLVKFFQLSAIGLRRVQSGSKSGKGNESKKDIEATG